MCIPCSGVQVVLSTFVAVFVMHPVQVVDGVHRVELDLGQVFVTDPVELRGGVGGGRPRHVVGSHGDGDNSLMDAGSSGNQ